MFVWTGKNLTLFSLVNSWFFLPSFGNVWVIIALNVWFLFFFLLIFIFCNYFRPATLVTFTWSVLFSWEPPEIFWAAIFRAAYNIFSFLSDLFSTQPCAENRLIFKKETVSEYLYWTMGGNSYNKSESFQKMVSVWNYFVPIV